MNAKLRIMSVLPLLPVLGLSVYLFWAKDYWIEGGYVHAHLLGCVTHPEPKTHKCVIRLENGETGLVSALASDWSERDFEEIDGKKLYKFKMEINKLQHKRKRFELA